MQRIKNLKSIITIITSKEMTTLGNLSEFEKKMRILGTPYKHSSAYNVYGDLHQELPKRSVFWETHIGYIEKYQHAKFKSVDGKRRSTP